MFSIFDLLILSQIPTVGPARLRALVSHFKEPASVLRASARELAAVEGITKAHASRLARRFREAAGGDGRIYAGRQLSRLNKIGGRLVTLWDDRYPELLKRIYDPPPLLFMRGDFSSEDRCALAIVGTRHPSEYGIAMAERFSREFSSLGITVVSGLARGVDTAAHASALESGGRTIGVMGSGLDVPYPPENRALADRVAGRGAVVSECEMGARPEAGNFPRRNRIISGLSLGTLVVETDITGGAMITANAALDQNREVFALPGELTSKRSKGCHALIKEGRAKLVETLEDILSELSVQLRGVIGASARRGPKAATELTLFERNF